MLGTIIAVTDQVTVFRFRRSEAGRDISPQHMWGTREAIAGLGGCILLEDSARSVAAAQLEGGFFYDIPDSISLKLDSPLASN